VGNDRQARRAPGWTRFTGLRGRVRCDGRRPLPPGSKPRRANRMWIALGSHGFPARSLPGTLAVGLYRVVQPAISEVVSGRCRRLRDRDRVDRLMRSEPRIAGRRDGPDADYLRPEGFGVQAQQPPGRDRIQHLGRNGAAALSGAEHPLPTVQRALGISLATSSRFGIRGSRFNHLYCRDGGTVAPALAGPR